MDTFKYLIWPLSHTYYKFTHSLPRHNHHFSHLPYAEINSWQKVGTFLAFRSNDGLTWHQRKANLKRWYRVYLGSHNFAIITTLLLAVNIGVYLFETFSQIQYGNIFSINPLVLIKYGASYVPFINAGDYWRLWTPMFVHVSPIHLGLNMVTLYLVGPVVEQKIGSIRMGCVYLLSGLAGNFVSFLFSQNTVSAGASTSLFGLIVYAALITPSARQRLASILVVNLAFNLIDPSVNIYGHLGGLIGGVLLAALFFDIDEIDFVRVPSWIRTTFAVGLTLVLFTWTIFNDYLP